MRYFVLLAALFVFGAMASAQEPESLDNLFKRVERYLNQGDFVRAAPLAERALQRSEQLHGPAHLQTGIALNQLGVIKAQQGRFLEAEKLLARAVKNFEKTLPGQPALATAMANLGSMHQHMSRMESAEDLFKRAIAIYESQPAEPPDFGSGLGKLAGLYHEQGRYADAEHFYRRAVEAFKRVGDDGLPPAALASTRLAKVYWDQGRFDEAEPLLTDAIAVLEEHLGSHDRQVGMAATAAGIFYDLQGRYARGEAQHQRALEIARELGNGIEVATALSNLATNFVEQDRLDEAERLYQEGLRLFEQALGGYEHRSLADLLYNYSVLLLRQGRFEEAASLRKRLLVIVVNAVGTDHLEYANALDSLAELLVLAKDYETAEKAYLDVLSIRSKAMPESPEVALTGANLAGVLRGLHRFREAEQRYQRSIAIWQKAHGPNHVLVASALTELATTYAAEGRYDAATPIFERALRIRMEALGPDHGHVGETLHRFGDVRLQQGRWREATDLLRRATDIFIRRAARGSLNEGSPGRPSDLMEHSEQFANLLKAAYRLSAEGNDPDRLAGEMFARAQWMQASKAAKSVAQMAVRGAAGKPVIGEQVRERQGLVAEWQQRDKLRTAAFAMAPDKRDGRAQAANLARLAAIDTQLADIDKRLAAEFPAYAALARSAPLTIDEVQAQLGADEALLQFVDTESETFVWAVTKSAVRWVRLDVDGAALKREVTALRCGLDAAPWYVEASDRACQELTKGMPKRDRLGNIFYETLPFDTARAHALYKSLFGQLHELIAGKHLLVVLSGSLTQLPLHVLVSEAPATEDFRATRWLVRDHAVTVLPSVSSLKALRLVARPSAATQRMIGFGNPLLQGDPKNPQEAKWAAQAREAKVCKGLPNLSVAGAYQRWRNLRQVPIRSGYASLDHLKSQVPLPDTAGELCTVASALKLAQDDIFLGARATETTVKRLSMEGRLANYRVVHFATHGGVAGEIKGTSEPGLILTPPDRQTDLDDGYLTASEVSALKLDADWVILSACNTAAGEDGAAEALSGLARAFFFAGARALLASHWAVESPTTVKLVTSTLTKLVEDRKAGRAEVLRRAMLNMIDAGEAREAHPAFWAPFVVVGEGGTGR